MVYKTGMWKAQAVVLEPSCFKGHGAVATDSKICSEIGRDILAKGGSAVDAAIAALLCISIIHPQSMGLGGGLMFTVMEKSGKVKIINARSTVPQNYNPNLLKDCSRRDRTGSQWIGVPGEILGYEEAHRRYGKLNFSDLFQPAIKLAKEGVTVSHILEYHLQQHCLSVDAAPLCKLFYKNGTLLKAGDTVKYNKLARTLVVVAEEGTKALYNGTIAQDLIQDIKDAGGKLSLKDLQSFKVEVTDAWNVSIGEYKMHFPRPPAGGALIGFILNVMKGYNLSSDSVKGDGIQTYHRYVVTCDHANKQRNYTRDYSFVSQEFRNASEKLIKEEFAAEQRQQIDAKIASNLLGYNTNSIVDSVGTTHISVLDENGTAVSVTSTINDPFGSKVYSPKTGIILNNLLADFCELADRILPGERPPSFTAPSVLYSKSKQETLVIGGSGGQWITTRVALALMNYLWFGKDLEQAIKDPVVFVNSTYRLDFETGFNQAVKDGLRGKDYEVGVLKNNYTAVNAVLKKNNCITAWSDKRKGGVAAGY
ncbi:glutathione hydrolase 5 proenzyme-like [Megalops cyprinoides]|uniref:glutathione hydrolase 5 proenzyme-like n=1 Tax=Megalops cyprinoides TaxID=118141 RepID=UPI001863B748|nr:glutathione hydrolase 5 proenzyme-like [Megalops cyprinoides]